MALQTILLTTRNIKRERNKGNTLFGENLNTKSAFRMATATTNPMYLKRTKIKKIGMNAKGLSKPNKKPYNLSLIETGQEAAALQEQLAQYNNGRPWVFFVHGNNQTFKKNLAKSRVIQKKYDVNMVIFSWPSRSYNDKLGMNLALSVVLGATLKSVTTLYKRLGKSLEKKIIQYKAARKMATASLPGFHQAFLVLQQELLNPLKARDENTHVSMLVHSLGHKLLKEATPDFNGFQLNKVLLHQADELAQNHVDWIKQLNVANTQDITVTRNLKDIVLFLSDMMHNIIPENGSVDLAAFRMLIARYFDLTTGDGIDDTMSTRVGNRKELANDYGDLQFIDFEDAGQKHDPAWNEDSPANVIDEIRPILCGA